jgi:hypothetical protein
MADKKPTTPAPRPLTEDNQKPLPQPPKNQKLEKRKD